MKEETYYGFKFHKLVTLDGYLSDFTLTDVNIDGRIAIRELSENLQFSIAIANKGYVGDKLALDLRE